MKRDRRVLSRWRTERGGLGRPPKTERHAQSLCAVAVPGLRGELLARSQHPGCSRRARYGGREEQPKSLGRSLFFTIEKQVDRFPHQLRTAGAPFIRDAVNGVDLVRIDRHGDHQFVATHRLRVSEICLHSSPFPPRRLTPIRNGHKRNTPRRTCQ